MGAQPAQLRNKVIIRFIAGILGIAALLFLPTGSFLYWQGWLYFCVLFVPMLFVLAYLTQYDPELLARRMRTWEKEQEQKTIIIITT